MSAGATFAGFPAATFRWFAGLEAENTREWFSAHRDTYERAVRGPLEAMLDELAAELGGPVKVFRQHRDVRFSPDKSPYKTRTYGVAGDAPGAAGLYVEVSRAGLLVGGGYHVLAPDQLERFRAAVAADATGPALEAAVARALAAGVELYGEALKTAPRGYPRDHPRAALLRHRALFGGDRLAPGPDGIGRDAALDHARATRAALADVSGWLDAHVGPTTADDPGGRGGADRRAATGRRAPRG